MASRNSNSGWSRGWAAFFAVVIILGGVAVSLGFGVRLRSALERNAERRMEAATVTLQTTVEEQLGRYIDTVRLTAAALDALDTPTADTFTEITTAVAGQQLTAVRAIRFVVPATPEDVDEVGPYWRDRGARKPDVRPLKGAQQHLITVFARGLGRSKAPPTGVDQAAAPAEVEVARLARTSNGVAVSDAYTLLTDTGLPVAQRQLAFDVVAPVTGRDRKVAGYVMLSIAGTDFVSALLTRAAGDLLDAQLTTRSGSGTLAEVATVLHAGRSPDVRRAQDFEAGQRQWVLRTSADRDVLLPATGRTDMVIVLAGTVLVVMFGTLMYLQMSATKRIEQEIAEEVEERLAEMAATPPAEREADRPEGGPAEGGPAEGGPAEDGSAEGGPAEDGPVQDGSTEGGPTEGRPVEGGSTHAEPTVDDTAREDSVEPSHHPS